MKTHKLRICILAFGAVLFTSCSPKLLYTTLDVLRPAKVAFANDANDLLIINNAAIQPADYGHKTEFFNELPLNIRMKTDSMSIFCLAALTEDLEGKDFFSSVQLNPTTINKESEFFKPATLDEATVKKLCLENHTNVILSLDRIKVNDDLIENYLTASNSYLASLEFEIETSWSIHYLNNPEVTSVQYTDTVFWETESYSRKKAISDLPNRDDAMVDAALTVGHKAVNRFVPYWDKVDRYVFDPKIKLMRQGMDSVYVKNWKAAISLWETAYNKADKSWIQAQAANNIAVGYEITGDIDKALEYATRAYSALGRMTIVDYQSFMCLSNYVNELTERKNEMTILKKQLGD